MKALILAGSLVALSLGTRQPAPQPYRVAFDLSSRDTVDQKAMLRTISEIIATDHPAEQVEVVMYGKGPELVVPDRSAYIAQVQALMQKHVAFKVCAIAIRNNQIDKSQLMPGVEVVPDGIHELVMKEQDNWGYIKVAH
jgi:intracellular sulfur oxidation DsrE/DsrF family protein